MFDLFLFIYDHDYAFIITFWGDKFYSSRLKEFAGDNFKFDENGKKLSKREENTMGKGEIARYEQFLLFPQCFQKACFQGVSKGVIVWEWVKQWLWLLSHLPKPFLPPLTVKHSATRPSCPCSAQPMRQK